MIQNRRPRGSRHGSILLFTLLMLSCPGSTRRLRAACEDCVPPNAYRFSGAFTMDYIPDPVNGTPNTDAFDHLLGVPVEFTLWFEEIVSESLEQDHAHERNLREVTTGPAHIKFHGDPTGYLADVVAPSMEGASASLRLSVDEGGGTPRCDRVVLRAPEAAEYFTLEVSGSEIDVPVGADGYPELVPFRLTSGILMLRRFTTPFQFTDFASGPADGAFKDRRPYRFCGKFTLDRNVDPVNGFPNTNAFDHLLGVEVGFTLSFATVAGESIFVSDDRKVHEVTTGPAYIEFEGDPTGYLQDVVAPTFDGATLSLSLSIDEAGGAPRLDTFNFVGPAAPQYFGFEIAASEVDVPLDENGYPLLRPFDVGAGHVILRRYVTPFHMTDFASGPADYCFRRPTPYRFAGSFTLNQANLSESGVFDHLLGVEIQFSLWFDEIVKVRRRYESLDHEFRLECTTGLAHLEFEGDPTGFLDNVLGPKFEGATWDFALLSNDSGDPMVVLEPPAFSTPGGGESFNFELGMAQVDVPVDDEGYPVLAPFAVEADNVTLRRLVKGSTLDLTDFFSGSQSHVFEIAGSSPDGDCNQNGAPDANQNGVPDAEEQPFRRGDSNADGRFNIADATHIFGFLFRGSDRPPCREAADTNNDGKLDLSDGIAFLNFLFLGGSPPARPGPGAPCAIDPSTIYSGCEAYYPCER